MLIYTQKINRAGMPSRPPHPPAPPPPPWGAGSLPDRRVAVLEGGVDLGKHLGADPRRGPEADARKERKRVAGRSPFVQTFLMVLFLAVLKPPSPKRAQTFMFRGVCGSVGPESSGRGFARLSALSDFRLCVNCAIHGIGLDPRLSIPPGANCPEGGGVRLVRLQPPPQSQWAPSPRAPPGESRPPGRTSPRGPRGSRAARPRTAPPPLRRRPSPRRPRRLPPSPAPRPRLQPPRWSGALVGVGGFTCEIKPKQKTTKKSKNNDHKKT